MKNYIVKFGFITILIFSAITDASGQLKNSLSNAGNTLQKNTETLTGKVMCGYQGWFAVPSDAINRGWYHYTHGSTFEPGNCKIDLWPDVSDFDDDEKYITSFTKANGNPALVFSSQNKKTVVRHFKWMHDYGIDGVFIQRFITEVKSSSSQGYKQWNNVLASCREGANEYGRTIAIMYDLSGLGAGQIQYVINDWKMLVDQKMITKDSSYQYHNGKPVVAVWGIGFNDGRKYTLSECSTLIDFLKNDPKYGGNTVMVGVPTNWRTLSGDAVNDTMLHKVILQADIVSPWFVGRPHTLSDVESITQSVTIPDMDWCRRYGKEYLPVVFPGFSWHNMNLDSPSNLIPRLKGKFLWKQYYETTKAGATMIYQAMFDEIDEGTAIFKCTNEPPIGASTFVTYEGLETDFYLWLVGQGKRMLDKDINLSADIPDRYPGLLKFPTNNTGSELDFLVPGFTGSVYSDHRQADEDSVIAYRFSKDKLVQLSGGIIDMQLYFELSNEFIISVASTLDGQRTQLFRWNTYDVHIHDGINKQIKQIDTKSYFANGWDNIYVFIEDGIKSCTPGASIHSIKISAGNSTSYLGKDAITPDDLQLFQNYPNPFNPTTQINYSIPDSYEVELNVYDLMGQKIKTLIAAYQHAGDYHTSWDGKNSQGISVPSGIYFYRLTYKDKQTSRKMLLLR